MALNIAIVGAGLMGGWHAHSARKLGMTVAAVIDKSQVSSEKLAKQYGSQAFTDLPSALAQVEIDVVHICTPLATHVELATVALEASKHVVIEKPIAGSVAETEALIALAVSKKLIIAPVHQFAFQTGITELKNALQHRNELPSAVSFDFASAGGVGRTEAELNKILVEILPHPLSILLEVWPMAAAKDSRESQGFVDKWFVDSSQCGELFLYGHYERIPVSIKISLHARPTHCNMKVYHSEGAIHLNLFHGFAVREAATVSRVTKILAPFQLSIKTLLSASMNLIKRLIHSEPAYPGLRSLMDKIYDAVNNNGEPPISAADMLQVADCCEWVEKQICIDHH